MSEFELRRRLKALNQERQPSTDLWAGIQGQLSGVEPWRPARESRRMLWPWAAAASVALAVLSGMWLGQRVLIPAGDGTTVIADGRGGSASAESERIVSPLLEREADALRVSYEAAIAATRDGGGRASLRPDYVAASRELDAAAAALRTAIAQDPQAVYLLDLLRRTEERRLTVARLAAA